MEPIIFTPRLKLTLVTKAERGSPELEWMHELRSNERSTWWSIYGRSNSLEDTEKVITGCLPTNGGEEKTYRVAYAVHKILEPDGDKQPVDQATKPTEFIGLVNLASLDANGLPLPADLGLPTTPSTTTLTAELGYNFLPSGWGKGYATESVNAVLEACRCKKSFWSPYSKLFVRAIVNEDNPASGRVMDKVGMEKKGVYHWTGKAVFLAGRWQEKSTVFIYGMYLLE